jgi:hypothetical protein
LSDCFIDPALAYLREHGAEIGLHARLRRVEVVAGLARRLDFTNGLTVTMAEDEFLVLAVPPAAAAALLPGLVTPEESRAIVNAHFRVSRSVPEPTFIGLVGAISQWIFVRDDVVSVTVSAANGLVEEANEAIAAKLWPEVCLALGFKETRLPACRIVKEKRATFAQTPAELARRPGSRTRVANVVLAGDWTDTGLPATLEGSVRSGHTAVATVLASATSA